MAGGHVVLLGDSIFDNAAYVSGPDVVRQLRAALPEDWQASLLARDGAIAADVPAQVARLPADASLLVVSAGGNDALGNSYLLQQPAGSVGEAVMRLAQVQAQFAESYALAVDAVEAAAVPFALCTIYDTAFPPPEDRVIKAALCLFNDVITRQAFARGVTLIDLRLICSEPGDYANPIEPSVQGGAKIAAAIARLAMRGVAEDGSIVIAG